MKASRLFLLALFLPSILFAATPQHQAYGPIKFGMPSAEALKAFYEVTEQAGTKRGKSGLFVTDLRNHFVTSGARRPSQFSALENTIKAHIALVSGLELSSIRAFTQAETYAEIKQPWQVLQALGDCKFTRIGKIGTLPTEEEIRATASDAMGIPTDTWETEGIRIILYVRYSPAVGSWSRTGEIFEAQFVASVTTVPSAPNVAK